MRKYILLIIVSFILNMETVQNLDIEKFMGKWNVISTIPNFFEKGCYNSYDLYSLNEDGSISIEYHAFKNNKKVLYKQQAQIIDTLHKSKWKIRLTKPWIPFFRAPYQVIVIDSLDYNYMVVGYSDKSLGWIMSRDREMSEGLYAQILGELVKKFDYNKDSFEKVIQHK